MKKKLTLFIAFIALVFISSSAFANVNYTIKKGPGSNQIQVFANFTTAITEKVTQFVLVLGYKNSDLTGTAPALSFTIDPSWNTKFGSSFAPVNDANHASTSPLGYTYTELGGTLTPGSTPALLSGEILLGTVSFSGGEGAAPVYLLDFADAGSDGQGNTYIFTTPNNQYTPTSGNSAFYSTAGESTASTSNSNSFLVTNTSVILPTTGLHTSVKLVSALPFITWSTVTELNTSYFEVEKSADGNYFTAIGKVAATGSGSSYNFTDKAASGAIAYYRIKAIDKDGHVGYGDVVAVRLDGSIAKAIRIFPNPVSQLINIETAAGIYIVDLYSFDGKKLLSQKVQSLTGLISLPIDRSAISAGTYHLKLTEVNTKLSSTGKVVVQ